MLRALIIFIIIFGIVLGGLMLLRRTANTPPPKGTRHRLEKPEDEDDTRGW